MPTQEQMFRAAQGRAAAMDRHFFEMVNHPTNPITNDDLRRLVARAPARWGRFAGYIGKLPN